LLEKTSFSDFSQFSLYKISSNYRDLGQDHKVQHSCKFLKYHTTKATKVIALKICL